MSETEKNTYNTKELDNAKSLFRATSIADDNDLGAIIDKLNSTGVDPCLLNLSDFELEGVEDNENENDDSDAEILASYVKDSSLRLYLRDVGEISKRYGLLEKEEEVELAKKAENGDLNARDVLISSNLRLVIKYARRFAKQGVAVEDLIQEGNLGLCMAADKYDYRKGFRFSTYATWWILQRIRKIIITKYHVITIPTHVYYKAKTLRRAMGDFEAKYGRVPSKEELSEVTGIPLKTVESVFKIPTNMLSLEDHVDGDDSSSFSELLNDPEEISLEDSVANELLKKKIAEKLHLLTETEQRVIIEYFFNDKKLQQIGKDMSEFKGRSITRERTRQIRQEALRKLRLDNELKGLSKEL